MKKTEELFAKESNFDSKNILNRLNQKVNQSILDKIEAGITLEDLDLIGKQGIPVFKYKTQITIHGLFEKLETSGIFGYQNLFQNKNKSIGIRWNAIDEKKRRAMDTKLSFLGFYYNRNSTAAYFSFSKALTADSLQEAKDLFAKVDTNLFLGTKYLWIGEAFGARYINLDIHINAIYEKNVQPFLDGMGATEDFIQAKTAERKKKEQERENAYKLAREQKEQEKAKILKENEGLISLLDKYPQVKKTQEPGIYVRPIFDFKDRLVYSVSLIYMPARAKKPRWNNSNFDNIEEALKHQPQPSFSDSVLNGTISGYKTT